MKVLLRIFIPLCVFSFIAFGISVAIFGTNHAADSDETTDLVMCENGSEKTIDRTDSFSSIKADTGAFKISIKPWSEPTAQITVTGGNDNRIKAGVSGDTLNIRSEWNWNGDWFKNIFNGSAFCTEVTVKVPDKTYEELNLYVGAGSLISDGVKAKEVSLDVDAGSLTYTQPADFHADEIKFDVSAGSLIAKNADTSEYRVEVSAGSAQVYGLTGKGKVDVSAGSAKLEYARFDEECDVDVSAGEAYLDIPEDSSARFICDKSAGDIRIMVGNENKRAEDGDVITTNGGSTDVKLSVSAGDIKVVSSSAPATTIVTTAIATQA